MIHTTFNALLICYNGIKKLRYIFYFQFFQFRKLFLDVIVLYRYSIYGTYHHSTKAVQKISIHNDIYKKHLNSEHIQQSIKGLKYFSENHHSPNIIHQNGCFFQNSKLRSREIFCCNILII